MKKTEDDFRRLFFGAQIEAPWPREYPTGRLIPEETRHVTLAFLGQQPFYKLHSLIHAIPIPSFPIGPSGIAQKLVFLPPEKERVVAWEVKWFEESLSIYQKTLNEWLEAHNCIIDKRPFYSHISLARSPFDHKQWASVFSPLPVFVKAIRLYQSLGNLNYKSLWESVLLPPFEEFEHTADIAFLIRGQTIEEIYFNALMALAFKFPPIVEFFRGNLQNSLEEIIISLNESIGFADAKYGCPFKAVSFHGTIKQETPTILSWEMIVDV